MALEEMITPEMVRGLIEAIGAAMLPLVAFIITELKKRLSNTQGDLFFQLIESWIIDVETLSKTFPEIVDIAAELKGETDKAKELWNDPRNNTAEMMKTLTHCSILHSQAMNIVAMSRERKEGQGSQ